MKCQILFSEKNKKNIINLSSAENAQRVVRLKRYNCIRQSENVCIQSNMRLYPILVSGRPQIGNWQTVQTQIRCHKM